MASRYYVGRDGDFNTTDNWSTAVGGAGGETVPVSNDDVFIYDLDHALATNVNQGAVDLGSLSVTLKPGGALGSPGDPFTISVAGTGGASRDGEFRLSSAGGGPCYIRSGSAGVTLFYARGCALFLSTESGSGFNSFNVYRCTASLASSFTSSSLSVFDSNVSIAYGSDSLQTITQYGSTVFADRTIVGAWNLYGGVGTAGPRSDGSAVTTYPGARFTYQGAGTLTTVSAHQNSVINDDGNRFGFTCTLAVEYGGKVFREPVSDITITTRGTFPYQP